MGGLTFDPASSPTDAEVAQVLDAIRQRVRRLLRRSGLEPGDENIGPEDPLAEASPALAGIVGASVQGRVALGTRAGARVRRPGHGPTAGSDARRPRHAHWKASTSTPTSGWGSTTGRAENNSVVISSAPAGRRSTALAG